MTLTRLDINIDCNDIEQLEDFWTAALGYEPQGESGQYRSLRPSTSAEGGALPKLVLQQVPERPAGTKNRLHLDLIVGAGFEAEADRLAALGATRLGDVVREADTAWIVMADPEGNVFCVCEC